MKNFENAVRSLDFASLTLCACDSEDAEEYQSFLNAATILRNKCEGQKLPTLDEKDDKSYKTLNGYMENAIYDAETCAEEYLDHKDYFSEKDLRAAITNLSQYIALFRNISLCQF